MNNTIGAEVGGQGAAAPPGNILPPLGDLRSPWELYSESNKRSRKSANTFYFREHLLLGQERGPNPVKTFFLF